MTYIREDIVPGFRFETFHYSYEVSHLSSDVVYTIEGANVTISELLKNLNKGEWVPISLQLNTLDYEIY